MGKTLLLSSLFLFTLIIATTADAFIAQRTAWWNIRLEELADKKAMLTKKGSGSPDRRILNLIDREIARGRDTLDLLKKNLSSEPRSLSPEEIRTMIHQALLPLYSLRCLESIIENTGNEKAAATARDAYERMSAARLRALMAPAQPEESGNPATVRLDSEETDQLALELVIGGVINRYDANYRDAAAAIEREILAGAPKSSIYDIIELKERITDSAVKKCSALEPVTGASMEGALEQSWTWRGAKSALDREAGKITEIRRLLTVSGAQAPLEKSGYLARNPLSLDQLYFARLAEKYQTRFDGTRTDEKKGKPERAFHFPDFAKITRSVDTQRRRILQGIHGREDGAFFAIAEAGLRGAGERITRPVERKIEACERGECENARELTRARKSLDFQRKLAAEYAGESLSFVKWISKSRSVNGTEILAHRRYRADRSVSYINFVRSLVEKSAGIAPLKSPDHHLKYAVYVKNAPRLFAGIQASNVIDRAVLPSLTADENSEIRALKSALGAAVNAAQRDISAAFSAYYARHGALNRAKSAKEEKRDAGVAQYDMDQMAATLNDYVTLYGALDYSDKALKRYHDLYRKLEGAEGGTAARMRDDAVRSGSIIPLLENFDTAAMAREHATRTYLRKEIRMMVSRIRSLANLFRQYDISTGHIMSHADSSRILDRLDKNPQAPVADWMMNETNAANIDLKAVQKLSQTGMKRDWKVASGEKIAAPGTVVEMEGLSIKFTLPEGWVEDRADSYHNERGIVKIYRSRDNTSSIEVARITPLQENPLNERSLTWHRKIGSRVMKGKWGRQDGKEYYWTIARDEGAQVRESYAFGDGSNTVIISGSTPRERFGFFHKKFEGVIASMNK